MKEYPIGSLLPLDHEYLSTPDFQFSTDNCIAEYGPDWTGVLERVGDAEITEVWATVYRAPWKIIAIYERIR